MDVEIDIKKNAIGYFINIKWDGLFDSHAETYREWLNENVGRCNWQYCGPGSTHPNMLRFDHREDALAFKLKFNL